MTCVQSQLGLGESKKGKNQLYPSSLEIPTKVAFHIVKCALGKTHSLFLGVVLRDPKVFFARMGEEEKKEGKTGGSIAGLTQHVLQETHLYVCGDNGSGQLGL